jgi:hypothetical protein
MGNPEGTDFSFDMDHEKEFSQEEFDNIVEEAFVYALEKRFKKEKCVFISSVETEYMLEYLNQKGFTPSQPPIRSYYLEPYWGKKQIRSEKLMAWVNRQDSEEAPKYFRDILDGHNV